MVTVDEGCSCINRNTWEALDDFKRWWMPSAKILLL